MGKKYIIEVEDKPFELLSEDGFTSEKLFRVKGFNSLVFDWNGLNMLMPYTEPDLEQVRKEGYEKGWKEAEDHYFEGYSNGYDAGLADAWEAARKFMSEVIDARFRNNFMVEIFECDNAMGAMKVYSATEALEKIRQYEQEKEEQIQVGDEIETPSGLKGYVVNFTDDELVHYVSSEGRFGTMGTSAVSKTGRHFPEIAEVLQKMKEANNG